MTRLIEGPGTGVDAPASVPGSTAHRLGFQVQPEPESLGIGALPARRPEPFVEFGTS